MMFGPDFPAEQQHPGGQGQAEEGPSAAPAARGIVNNSSRPCVSQAGANSHHGR